jgi:hypothetical protein
VDPTPLTMVSSTTTKVEDLREEVEVLEEV